MPRTFLIDTDTASDDAHSLSGLERLIHTDPIISQADPDDVVNLFNSVRQANPAMAKDVNAMRFALREALQYGALPQHTLKDMLSMRESLAKSRNFEHDFNTKAYG